MTCTPAVRRSPGVRLLTVACVPTGMNCGVSIVPCGVVNLPRRASPLVVSRTLNPNVAAILGGYGSPSPQTISIASPKLKNR